MAVAAMGFAGPSQSDEAQIPPDIFWAEVRWVAEQMRLPIPPQPSVQGSPTQEINKMLASRVVLYCARSRTAHLRFICEGAETGAYERLVALNEYPHASRAAIMGCSNADSYLSVEQCIARLQALDSQ